MTYDDWKLRSPDQEPGYQHEPDGCARCGEEECICDLDDTADAASGPCIGAECVNPHDHGADECATAEQMEAYERDLAEQIPLNPYCPYCRKRHDVDEVFDGSFRRCGHCGVLLVAREFIDGTMAMCPGETTPSSFTTGRRRTRALWRKRGRR